MEFSAKIGLETHVELLTKTKIFCRCKNEFSKEPDINCCEVCTGQPGAMPSLNENAVRLAVLAGTALGCEIDKYVYMARKNYVYPDLAKGYQITQSDRPLCKDGGMTLPSGSKIGIERIHIEEDAGKLRHEGRKVLIDYNRSGVPLIEIVTRPEFKSGDEVKEYLEMLTLLLRSIGVSDCKMQEGSLRCDINISLVANGKNYERSEIKNVNSYSFAKKAVEYEIGRQKNIIMAGGEPERETRRFDSAKGETVLMRKKESGTDYRYIDEPDILPIKVPERFILEAKEKTADPVHEKMRRYISSGLSYDEALAILKYPSVTAYFEELKNLTGDDIFGAKIIRSHVFTAYKEEERNGEILPEASECASVYGMIKSGRIDERFSKKIFSEMFKNKKGFSGIFSESDFSGFSDEEMKKAAKEAVSENPGAARDFLAGREKALFAILGSAMRKTHGKADHEKMKEIIEKIIYENCKEK